MGIALNILEIIVLYVVSVIIGLLPVYICYRQDCDNKKRTLESMYNWIQSAPFTERSNYISHFQAAFVPVLNIVLSLITFLAYAVCLIKSIIWNMIKHIRI